MQSNKHRYQIFYDSLLEKQPEHLSSLDKHIRIDILSCLDMKIDASVNKEVNCRWFVALSVILNNIYIKELPEIVSLNEFKVIAYKQLGLITLGESTASEILAYIKDRKQLIDYLNNAKRKIL
jgi:hypothetical protein